MNQKHPGQDRDHKQYFNVEIFSTSKLLLSREFLQLNINRSIDNSEGLDVAAFLFYIIHKLQYLYFAIAIKLLKLHLKEVHISFLLLSFFKL